MKAIPVKITELSTLRVFMKAKEAADPALARRNRRFGELVAKEQKAARAQIPPPAEMSRYSAQIKGAAKK